MASINLGYVFATEAEAQEARQQAANYYGFPLAEDSVTQYYVDYHSTPSGKFCFAYIDGLVPLFGEPQDISELFISGSI
jgi:hypothetical protein